jgi:hypothetical protein
MTVRGARTRLACQSARSIGKETKTWKGRPWLAFPIG